MLLIAISMKGTGPIPIPEILVILSSGRIPILKIQMKGSETNPDFRTLIFES